MKIERLPLEPELKKQLVEYVYDVIGYIQETHNDLGPGMPEYIYQEGLAKVIKEHGIEPEKELQFHPVFHGEPMDAYLKMDLVVPRERGNIIIECKAIKELGDKERYQLFGYMRGTEFPIGILVNFGTWPRAEVERYYYNRIKKEIRAF